MKMASSQVEIAPSSPFGHVLRDRNHQPDRYRTRDSNAFQKNFKDLVQNHLNSCISRNPGSSNSSLSQQRMDYADLWVHNPQGPNNENNNIDSSEGGCNNRNSSDHSIVNEGSQQRVDYTDLWVHNPQRSTSENEHVKTRSPGKWDRARDAVISTQRKTRDGVSSESISNSQKGGSQNDPKSQPGLASQRSKSVESTASQGRNAQRERLSRSVSTKIGEKDQKRRQLHLQPVRTREREKSPARSECSADAQNFCGVSSLVSSLVQKWRGFESEGKSLSLTSSPVCGAKMNPGLFFAECPSFADAEMKSFDVCDESAELKPETPMTNEDSFADWESCRTGVSGPPSSVGRDSDATESDRIKVADIIRKLSSNGEVQTVVHESLPRVRTSYDQAEQRMFSPVSPSPRLRGRQVFCDLLMQFERDRQRELEGLKDCKAVSRFSYKGRIQAMLRLRFLRLGSELKGEHHSKYSLPHSKRVDHSAHSAILRKRSNSGRVNQVPGSDMTSKMGDSMKRTLETEKSCASADRKEKSSQVCGELANPTKVVADKNVDVESTSESNPLEGEQVNNHDSTMGSMHESGNHQNRLEIMHQEDSRLSVTDQATTSASSIDRTEFTAEEISPKDLVGNSCTMFQEAGLSRVGSTNGISSAQGDLEEQEDDGQNLMVSDSGWASDLSRAPSGWEELHSDYMQLEDINRDWISDVARPRSTWEHLRKERYQEMRDPFQENEDIRRLLERKSVSSFLSSGLRERIDQLMVARTQMSNIPSTHAVAGERPHRMEEEKEERMQDEQTHEVRKEEEKLDEERGDEEEKDVRQEECLGHNGSYKDDEKIEQNNEAVNYADETMSWVQDSSVSDNQSDQAASLYIEESPLSNTYTQGTGPSSSSNNHPSIEIELMQELRGNMEQLRQEVAELRRSMKTCMKMQMELQQSFKKDVAPTFSHSGRKKRKDAPVSQKSYNGRCCICYDTQVDTLLYRCGHMCTCFNCACELQWGSGKCPVCRAPILDVVQAYFHP